jgi:hypothetical protein
MALLLEPLGGGDTQLTERARAHQQHLGDALGPPFPVVDSPARAACRSRRPGAAPHRLDDRALREAQRGGPVGDLDRLGQLLAQGGRVARGGDPMPGTTPSSDRSHMPLCDGPSLPVTPARSSTRVTPLPCSATSISSWSNARLRNVE